MCRSYKLHNLLPLYIITQSPYWLQFPSFLSIGRLWKGCSSETGPSSWSSLPVHDLQPLCKDRTDTDICLLGVVSIFRNAQINGTRLVLFLMISMNLESEWLDWLIQNGVDRDGLSRFIAWRQCWSLFRVLGLRHSRKLQGIQSFWKWLGSNIMMMIQPDP